MIIFNPSPRPVPVFPIHDGWAASTALWGCITVAAIVLVVLSSGDPYRHRVHVLSISY
jgi:hypothetical protein